MIDKAKLDQLQTFWRLGGLYDCVDLLKNGTLPDLIYYARIGLATEGVLDYAKYVCCCGCGVHEAIKEARQKAEV